VYPSLAPLMLRELDSVYPSPTPLIMHELDSPDSIPSHEPDPSPESFSLEPDPLLGPDC